jgi:hypothetical protein
MKLRRNTPRADRNMAAINAWRRLVGDWQPTLEQLQALERKPPEYREALRVISEGWSPDDARWDVLLALFEYNRRESG